MREYKFRTFMNGSFIYSGSNLEEDNQLDMFFCLALPGVEIEQFTGLHDKNGKEIYEGDILKTSIFFESSTLPHMGEVVYSDEYCSFATKNEGGTTLFCSHAINNREVTGNIHENPELLNV